MAISHSFIDEIKYRNKIDDVISSYVNLKRAGSNMIGLCPFHTEKTPSFTVFSSTDNFYCFGCGAGGDVITFIEKAENLDYMSALEFLAKRAGLTMPEGEAGDGGAVAKRARVIEMNREAAKFFHRELFGERGAAAREYIAKRQLAPQTVTHFGIGYAPDGFSGLKNHLSSLGFTDAEMKEAFLCGKSERTGSYYDYFRNRVMFPIIDNFGNVIAFGGRAIGDATPKYLNTSDTPAFKKSRSLYALNFARTCCSEYLILCEGYMDVIAVNAGGFPNAVATLGTALTQEQARLMAKYTKRVVLSYDSDEAGQNAVKRAMPMLNDAGLEVRILRMPGAKDPDEYIKKFGKDRFRLQLEGSMSGFDFIIDNILSKYNIVIPEEKLKAAGELCKSLAEVKSDVEREIYIARTASKLSLETASVKSDVERLRRKEKRAAQRDMTKKLISGTLGYGDRINREYINDAMSARAEESIIGILLVSPELLVKIRTGAIPLAPESFVTEFNRRVFSEMISSEGAADIGLLGQSFSADEISRITSMQVKRAGLTDNGEKVLREYIDALLKRTEAKSSGDSLEDTMNIINSKKRK